MNRRVSSKSAGESLPVKKHSTPPAKNNKYIWIAVIALVLLLSICICGLLGGGFLFKDRLLDLFEGQQEYGLVLNRRSEDGSVSGVYRGTGMTSGSDITFSVSEDGYAVFKDDGSGNSLIVDGREDPVTTIQWDGVLFDGVGGLSVDEKNAMLILAESEMLTGISMIPLDAACLGEDQISARQLAALLIPLQMHLKYNEVNRSQLMNSLLSRSACDYSGRQKSSEMFSPVIYYSPAEPVPVVPGYFPFDAEGAVELETGSVSRRKLACANNQQGAGSTSANINLFNSDLSGINPLLDEFGACNAMCRGACGADCTRNNCTFTTEQRCEKNAKGENTGWATQINIYNCGLHPACIKHDACYDTCNSVHGCNTWAAAYCMHGGYNFEDSSLLSQFQKIFFPFCDRTTAEEENTVNVARWVNGFGPQPERRVYEYTDKDLKKLWDVDLCPTLETQAEKTDKVDDQPQNPIGKDPYDPIDPCLFLPPGGTVHWQSQEGCRMQYGSGSPFQQVTVKVYEERPDMDFSCQLLASYIEPKVEREFPVGECGYIMSYPSVPADWNLSYPVAWGISFLQDRFEVEVVTEGLFDVNAAWVYGTASDTADQITLYLTQVGP